MDTISGCLLSMSQRPSAPPLSFPPPVSFNLSQLVVWIMIPYLLSSGGKPTYDYWRSMRFKRCPMRRSPIRLSNASSALCVESIWTTVFSGTSMTWKRSWRLSGVITTGRVRTKGWRATRRRKRRALESPNLPTSTITLGSRTVMGYSNCQSPHE